MLETGLAVMALIVAIDLIRREKVTEAMVLVLLVIIMLKLTQIAETMER